MTHHAYEEHLTVHRDGVNRERVLETCEAVAKEYFPDDFYFEIGSVRVTEMSMYGTTLDYRFEVTFVGRPTVGSSR